MVDIPLTALDRILRRAGCKRVNLEAAETLRELTEDFASKIAKKAAQITEYSGRQTTSKDDILLAYHGFLEET